MNIVSNLILFDETIYWGISKTIKLKKSFLPQNKALDTGVSKMAFKKSKISLIGMLPEPISGYLLKAPNIWWFTVVVETIFALDINQP